MAELPEYERRDDIAILRVTNPPANALSRAVRTRLALALRSAIADPLVAGIVLAGSGGHFASGADIMDGSEAAAGAGSEAVSLRDLCDLVEWSEKPVVAVLEGTVYGGGFELGLAAHARVVVPGARFALPDVRIGLPPAAGGLQRLARLCGAGASLALVLKGQVHRSDQPQFLPLADVTTETDAIAAAIALCKAQPAPVPTRDRTTGFADPLGYAETLAKARAALGDRPDPLQARLVDLVEAAALLPFEAGLAMEEDAHAEFAASDRTRALRHVVLAERLAWRLDIPPDPDTPGLSSLAVLGGGTLGLQIVLLGLNAGLKVHWGLGGAEQQVSGETQIRQVYEKAVANGGMLGAVAKHRLARLRTGDLQEATANADMVVEALAVGGTGAVPEGVFRFPAFPGAIEAVGLRFSAPLFSTRLVEVIAGPGAQPRQIVAAFSLAKRLNKVPVLVRSTGESAKDRLNLVLHRALDALIDAGACPYAIDRALLGLGWTVPVFQSRDRLGLEAQAQEPRALDAVNWAERLVAIGRRGRTGGLGFYMWGRDGPKPDVEVTDLLDRSRSAKVFDAEHLQRLIVGALANEGARLLRSGLVRRASDIDVIAVLALDFPRSLGGPMMGAGLLGMFRSQRALDTFDHPDKAVWTPDPLWGELVKNGKAFVGR